MRLTKEQRDARRETIAYMVTHGAFASSYVDELNALDTIDALESEKALERAATLREVANMRYELGRQRIYVEGTLRKAILALIPFDAGSALDKHDAEIHQFYQSGEAWIKHETALAESIVNAERKKAANAVNLLG